MQILLVSNRFNKATEHMAEIIAEKLGAYEVKVIIDNGHLDLSGPTLKETDLIIVLGGDGTILRASRQYALEQIPVLGINMGTVGFLSHIEIGEFDSYLEMLINGGYSLDKRMILQVALWQGNRLVRSVYCLNEVVVRSKTSHMISLDISIDEQRLNTFKGDGVIIATPTGSTAYSLSAGGPVVDPELQAYIITYIAPHKLGSPGIVAAPNKTITLTPVNCAGAFIAMDGQVAYDFAPDNRIIIKSADVTFNMINFKKPLFFHNVGNKLGR